MQNLGATRCIMGDMQMANDKDSVIRVFSWKKDRLGEKMIVGRKLE